MLDDCSRKSDARSLCKYHYNLHRRSGTLDSIGTTPVSRAEFHRITEKNIESGMGTCSVCGPVDIKRKSNNRWVCGVKKREMNMDHVNYRWYNQSSSVAKEMRDNLEESQNNLCAICGSPPPKGRRLHLDHCHETGQVRGLLCHHCNVALGFVKDDISILESAIEYLTKTQQGKRNIHG